MCARRHRDVAHFVDAKYACKRSWKASVGILFRALRFPSCPQHAIIPARARHACASKCSASTYRASIVLTGAIHSNSKHGAFRKRRTRTLGRAHMNVKEEQTIHSLIRSAHRNAKQGGHAHAPIARTDSYTKWGESSFACVPPWHGAWRQPKNPRSSHPRDHSTPQRTARPQEDGAPRNWVIARLPMQAS